MLKGLRLSAKIWLGYATLLAVIAAVDLFFIAKISSIRQKADMLSKEYVPEVGMATRLSYNFGEMKLAVRGYGLSGDSAYLEQSNKFSTKTTESLKEATELVKAAPDLKALPGLAVKIGSDFDTYNTEIKQTEDADKAQDEARAKADAGARRFLAALNVIWTSQMVQLASEAGHKTATGDDLANRAVKIKSAYDIMLNGEEIRIANQKSMVAHDTSIVEKQIGRFDVIKADVERMRPLTSIPADLEALSEVLTATEEYRESLAVIIKSVGDMNGLNKKRADTQMSISDSARDVSDAGTANTLRLAEETSSDVRECLIVVLGCLVVASILGLSIAFFSVRSITGPMRQAADSLLGASRDIGSASDQLSASSQSLSSGASRSAAALEETSASLKEIERVTQANVAQAGETSKLAEEVQRRSTSGNESMRNLIESMKEISASNDKIQDLVKVIQEIGDKTVVIDEIVFQTKLLSFNASVEAERAGEHGRGFAVVAQEVGNLAEMSGKAALEIASIVKSSVKSAEAITQENRKKVERGDDLVKSAAGTLSAISESAELVFKAATQIFQSSKKQATAISQVNTSVVQLERDTQETNATAEESAAAAAELDAQANSLVGVVESLMRMVTGSSDQSTLQQGDQRMASSRSTHSHGHGPQGGRNVIHMDNNRRKRVSTPVAQDGGAHDEMKQAAGAEGDASAWERL